ncbi:hypothetical protein NMD1_01852 [Novosphingobium sp. MD-1]|nr:hypothetical protein NMD1_01852 [Novosphingobium sp. MD-1]
MVGILFRVLPGRLLRAARRFPVSMPIYAEAPLWFLVT